MRLLSPAVLLLVLAAPRAAHAEDGYRLWLRYGLLAPGRANAFPPSATAIDGVAPLSHCGCCAQEIAIPFAVEFEQTGPFVRLTRTGLTRRS